MRFIFSGTEAWYGIIKIRRSSYIYNSGNFFTSTTSLYLYVIPGLPYVDKGETK